MPKYTSYQDIPEFTIFSGYAVDVEWRFLEKQIELAAEGMSAFELNPDFQRGHVWTQAQQIGFVEFQLRGGRTGHDIYFNCPGFHCSVPGSTQDGPYQCVDGLQRLTAVRRFMANEIPAFGTLQKDYAGHLRLRNCRFKWHVNDLETRAEVLQWYLEFNSAGTPHTKAELDRVRTLLRSELSGGVACP